MTQVIDDPALLAQGRFRVLLQVLARPGSVLRLPSPERVRTNAEAGYLLAVATTLLDHEIGFALIGDGLPPSAADLFAEEVRMRCGAPRVTPAQARFVFVFGAAGASLEELSAGSDEFPDESATLLWHVPPGFPTEPAVLSGPGINGTLNVALPAIGADDRSRLARINGQYPRGLDCFFVFSNGDLVGLPRGVRWLDPASV